jgi:hypothetical protein
MNGQNPNEMVLQAEASMRTAKSLAYEVGKMDYPDFKSERFSNAELMEQYAQGYATMESHIESKYQHGT